MENNIIKDIRNVFRLKKKLNGTVIKENFLDWKRKIKKLKTE